MREALSSDAIQQQLATVPDWQLVQSTLTREFVFPDFVRAFGFMASVAAIAQALDHHPDWDNVYNRVRIRLSTHDVNGLSSLDFEAARRIDQLVP